MPLCVPIFTLVFGSCWTGILIGVGRAQARRHRSTTNHKESA